MRDLVQWIRDRFGRDDTEDGGPLWVRGDGCHVPAIDYPRADEINAAIDVLVGVRIGRRKGQRMRHHMTYKQRDALARLLRRLHPESLP